MRAPNSTIGALAGLRVVDLCDGNGQYCGKLLADLGADVVKVEPPNGDEARRRRPYKGDNPHDEGSLFFAYRNTNKRSLAIAPDSTEGRAVLRDLVRWADVLLDSLESSPLASLGFTYERLHDLNPKLVMTGLSGVGTHGPYVGYQTTSSVVFALSGLMRLIGSPDGPPVAPPEPLAFDLASVDAATGTLLALLARERTGRGQEVQVAVLDVLAAQYCLDRGEDGPARRTASIHTEISPSGVYACRDGAVEMTIVMPGQWERLKQLVGNPSELADPSWVDPEYRRLHVESLTRILTSLLQGWSQRELVEKAQAMQVPCLPVHSVADFSDDPHTAARGFFAECNHQYLGHFRMAGAPYRMSEAGWALAAPPPRLGEHTRQILTEDLGYGEERAAKLIAEGVAHVDAALGASPDSTAKESPHLSSLGVAERTGKDPGEQGKPLQGIRVLAFSTAFAGPTLSRYLADYGADVIKVESRRRPDNTRQSQPVSEPGGSPTSLLYSSFNRNKLGVTINMSDKRGRDLVRRLVAVSDIVIENFSRRVLPGWGLDFENLRAIRPDIILLDMQGTGQTGPYRDYVTYGPALHSYTGLTTLWGYSHASFVDYVAAQHGVVAVLAALLNRARTGRGMQIDLAQSEAAAALLGTAYLDYAINGRVQRDMGNCSLDVAPHGCYRCLGADQWCMIAVQDDDAWRRFRGVMGDPHWAARSEFETLAGRLAGGSRLDGGIEEWTRSLSARAAEAALQAVGIAAAAVRSAAEARADTHLRARGFFVSLDHPTLGEHEVPGPTIQLADTPGDIMRSAPLLGEHNQAVLTGLLGLSDKEIADLQVADVLS